MSAYQELRLGDLFELVNGRAIFTRDYLDAHAGEHPVYSASISRPFGFADSFDYEGKYLTWVMNGYGGRMQEISGRFSINRDRGILMPKRGVRTPDLTYVRYAAEPELVANAVGRRVDGRLNEYTKIYPETAAEVVLQLPLARGKLDYGRMAEVGARIRRIEAAQAAVRATREPLEEAAFVIQVPEPSVSVSLSDTALFQLSIGKRVLQSEFSESGVPVYSANALTPFGRVAKSNLSNFSKPSLLWGIDGNFDWNLIPAKEEFATTDHCGRLQILDPLIDPEYVYWFLRTTRARYGFDRVYRAKLGNVAADVVVQLPLDASSGKFSKDVQMSLAAHCRKQEQARTKSLEAIEEVLKARVTALL